MEEHIKDYKIEIDERDKQNIVKGLLKLMDEKAGGIKQLDKEIKE